MDIQGASSPRQQRSWLRRSPRAVAKRNGILVVLLVLGFVVGCRDGSEHDLPLSRAIVADTQGLRVLPATETYEIAAGWFGTWSRVPFSFANFNRTYQHRMIVMQDNATQIAAIVAAAAQNPDFAPPSDPAVLSSTPLIPPSAGSETTYPLSFVPPGPGQYVYLCTVPGHYQAGMWGTFTITVYRST